VPGETRVVVTDDDAARRQAHAVWDELLDTMVDHQLPVDESASPRTVAEQLVGRVSLEQQAADGVRLLGRAEERARYARQPLQAERLTEDLSGALRAVRRAITRRVSRRTRLNAVLLPPSVTRRWRAATSLNAVRLTVGVGRRRDALLGAVSVRRLLPGRSGQ
jgi:ribosomal protein L16/L10AE